MSHPLWARVEPVVRALADDPLYRASAMGMELFHSNVLAWLLRTYPQAARPLAALLGFPPADTYGIWREWRHLDLVVDTGDDGHGLVLENKIQALPDIDQLRRYHADVLAQEPEREGRSAFVLLSLAPPVEAIPAPWRRVSYDQLSLAVAEAADGLPEGFDADFLRRYARLAGLLAALVDAAGIGGRPDEPFFLDASTQDQLRESGTRDLVLKIRTVGLIQATVAISLDTEGSWHEVGWSNGEPRGSRYSAAVSVPGAGVTHLGWQLQGRQLRIVAVFGDSSLVGRGEALTKAREAAADAALTRWLDPDRLQTVLGGLVSPYTGKKSFNHFAPDFVYRYGTLSEEVTPGDLIVALADLTHMAEGLIAEIAVPGGRAEGRRRRPAARG